METQPTTSTANIMRSLRENWFIVLFLTSLVIGWGRFENKISNAEDAIFDLKTIVKDQGIQLNKINNDFGQAIVEIKANYIFIKEKLEKLDSK